MADLDFNAVPPSADLLRPAPVDQNADQVGGMLAAALVLHQQGHKVEFDIKVVTPEGKVKYQYLPGPAGMVTNVDFEGK